MNACPEDSRGPVQAHAWRAKKNHRLPHHAGTSSPAKPQVAERHSAFAMGNVLTTPQDASPVRSYPKQAIQSRLQAQYHANPLHNAPPLVFPISRTSAVSLFSQFQRYLLACFFFDSGAFLKVS